MKKLKFQLSDNCEINLVELKTMLTTTYVLTLPEGSDIYVMYCDAFGVVIACVLMYGSKVTTYAS